MSAITIPGLTLVNGCQLNFDDLKKSEQMKKHTKVLSEIKNEADRSELVAILYQEIDKVFKRELLKGELSDTDAEKIKDFIIRFINEKNYAFTSYNDKSEFIETFMKILVGWGILDDLMHDPMVEDIRITDYQTIHKIVKGQCILTDIKFSSPAEYKAYIDNMLAKVGQTVNYLKYKCDARMSDNSRIHVDLQEGTWRVVIRKYTNAYTSLQKMVEVGSINKEIKAFLEDCMQANANILIAGAMGSGKTTLAISLLSTIPDSDAVTIIEDTPELLLRERFPNKQFSVLSSTSREANFEGKGAISLEQRLEDALRTSAKRIVIGEIRNDQVANIFFNIINSGHQGCVSTVHASSCEQIRTTMVTRASRNKNSVEQAIYDFNASVHVLIHMDYIKTPAGDRRVIDEISGIDKEGNITPIFKYDWESETWLQYPITATLHKLFLQSKVVNQYEYDL